MEEEIAKMEERGTKVLVIDFTYTLPKFCKFLAPKVLSLIMQYLKNSIRYREIPFVVLENPIRKLSPDGIFVVLLLLS